MSGERIFNGVNAKTGRYLRAPETEKEFVRRILDKPLNPKQLLDYKWWVQRYAINDPKRAPAVGVDPLKLSSSGWGVIFAPSISTEVQDALQPLLKRRSEQAGVNYRTYGPPAEQVATKEDFLTSLGVPRGRANPRNNKLPYYLLIVGSPEEIPFRFQYELDVQYAVGRIHFTDKDGKEDPEAYGAYARNVVETEKAAEQGSAELPPKRIALFGVSQQGDPATQRAEEELINPLAKILTEDCKDWKLERFIGPQADKAQLSRFFGGSEKPSLLFTACHGMSFPFRDSLQRSTQGALLCQDWPGENHPVLPEHYFSATDLSDDADLRGQITFHFACYSGGTPDVSSFIDNETTAIPGQVAPAPFISKLVQRLLSHPRGALAVVAHVDRAWSTSFSWSEPGQVNLYEETLKLLLEGHPLGSAMEAFNQCYAESAVDYSELRKDMDRLLDVDEAKIARAYRANNDVRNFVVLGDPAVKAVFRTENVESES